MRPVRLAPALLLLVVGCESKPPEAGPPASAPPAGAPAPRLSGTATDWRLATLEGVPVGVGDSVAPTLKLPVGGGRAGGYGGCNRWFAEATRSGEALSFSAIGATRMACEGPAMALEQRWFAALERVRRATEANGELLLADSAGTAVAVLRHY